MGSLCGKPSVEDTTSGPGRTIASTQPHIPSTDNRAQIPTRAGKPSVKVGGPGRTVGGVARDGEAVVVVEDPRAAAARAAEERANKAQQPKGRLGETLAAQKKRTQADILAEASREERGHRGADGNAVSRRWD